MAEPLRAWLRIAARPAVARRAARVSLVVGTVLVAINQGDALLAGAFTLTHWVKCALTYLVPYCVSTHASVSTLREHERRHAAAD